MDSPSQASAGAAPERRFREQDEQDHDSTVEVGVATETPLIVNMTDEPGGDPYNHTGRFRRMYR